MLEYPSGGTLSGADLGGESYAVQTGGFLSGKYRRGERPPEDSRIAEVPDEFEEAWTKRNVERNWRTLEVVGEISEETGSSYAQVSLNWLLQQVGVAPTTVRR